MILDNTGDVPESFFKEKKSGDRPHSHSHGGGGVRTEEEADAVAAALLLELEEEEEKETKKKEKKKKKKKKKGKRKEAEVDEDAEKGEEADNVSKLHEKSGNDTDDSVADVEVGEAFNTESQRTEEEENTSPAKSASTHEHSDVVRSSSTDDDEAVTAQPPSIDGTAGEDSDPLIAEMEMLVRKGDGNSIENLLYRVKGVAGYAVMRKTGKKALKKIKEEADAATAVARRITNPAPVAPVSVDDTSIDSRTSSLLKVISIICPEIDIIGQSGLEVIRCSW